MRAGTLREKIQLQQPTSTPTGDAWGPSSDYSTAHTVHASVLADGGSEVAGDHAVMTANSFTVRIRFLSDVASTWRILWRGRVLDVVSVRDPDGSFTELEIKAVENVGVGGGNG